jgi:hypothetical protein
MFGDAVERRRDRRCLLVHDRESVERLAVRRAGPDVDNAANIVLSRSLEHVEGALQVHIYDARRIAGFTRRT